VQVGDRGVAGLAGIDDEDAAEGAGEDEGGGQAGGSSADHCDVVLGLIHALRLTWCGRGTYERCCFRERGSYGEVRAAGKYESDSAAVPATSTQTPAIATALAGVGPRLKRVSVRRKRGI
jgi:hypothetical protein